MGDNAYPTELAGTAEAETGSIHAWALDDDDYDELPTERLRRRRSRRITAAALAGCLVLIASAGVVAVLVIRGVWTIAPDPATVVVAAPPTTTTAVPVVHAQPGPWITPTKPVTVTVQAPPKTIAASVPAQAPGGTFEQAVALDRIFLDKLTAEGWTITNPAAMAQNAHIVCTSLQRGVRPDDMNGRLMTDGGMSATEAALFSSAAMQTYPNCP